MFGVKEPTLREKEVISRKTTHSRKATYICKSEETTAQHLKDLATATDPNETHAFKHRNEKNKNKITERPKRFKGCQKIPILWRKSQAQEGKVSGVWKDLLKVRKELSLRKSV